MKLRRTISLLFGLVLCASSLHAQDTLVVSPHVGKVIDAEERAYYRLFPEVEDFRSAVFVSNSNGAQVQLVSRDIARMAISQENLELLRTYIRSYDSLYHVLHGAEFQPVSPMKFARARKKYAALFLSGIASVPARFDVEKITVQWQNTGDTTTHTMVGELIWATPSELLMSMGYGNYDSPIFIQGNAITSIEVDGGGSVMNALLGGVVGMVVGGVLGYLLGSSLPPEGTTAITGGFSSLGTTTGAIIGALVPTTEHTPITSMDEYREYLPQLYNRMYYRYGLPPNSPWREK